MIKLSLSPFGFGNKVNQAPWRSFFFATGIRPARKTNTLADHICHTWACYKWVRVGWIHFSWLSYNASKKYYYKGLTKQDFQFGINEGWAVHNLNHF